MIHIAKTLLVAATLGLALAAPPLHAQTAYTGPVDGTGSINDVGNWDNGLPTAGNPGTLAINARKTTNVAYTLTITNNATLTSTQGSFVAWGNNSDTHLTVANGSVSVTANTFIAGTATIVIEENGSFDTTNHTLNNGNTSNILINGGALSANSLRLNNNHTGPTGFLTLGAGNGSVVTTNTVDFGTNSGFINFLSGSGATLNFGTSADESYYSGLWDAGQLRIDGANTGTFADLFDYDAATRELSLSGGPPPPSSTLYTGPVGGSINDAANWDNGLPAATLPGTLATDAAKTADFTGTSDFTLTIGSGATLSGGGTYGGDTSWTIADTGTLAFAANSSLSENAQFSILTGGGATSTGDVQLADNATVVIETGASFVGAALVGSAGASHILVDGGTFSAGTIGLGADHSGAFLTLGSGAGSVAADNPLADNGHTGYIDFLGGSQATLRLGNSTQSYYESLWNAGQLRVNSANSGTFAENFDYDPATFQINLAPPAASTIYTGPAGGSINDTANWNNGLPNRSNPGLVTTNAVRTELFPAALVIDGGATLSFTGRPTIQGDAHIVNGTLSLTATGLGDLREGDVVIENNGSLLVPNSGFQWEDDTTVTVNGGRFEIHNRFYVRDRYDREQAFLTLGPGAGQVVSGYTTVAFNNLNPYINFLTGSQATLQLGGQGPEYYRGLWISGNLRIDDENLGTFADNFLFDEATHELSLNPDAPTPEPPPEPVPPPYDAWAGASGLAPGVNDDWWDDPDGDRLPNITEFALDSDPLSGASSGKMRMDFTPILGEEYLTLTLPVRDGAVFGRSPYPGESGQALATQDGVTYQIQGTENLLDYDAEVSEVTPPQDAGLPPLSEGSSYRTFQFPEPVSAIDRAFLRAKAGGDSRPNILFIIADDLGAYDLSNEGSTFYESPNIDRIANQGMKFTRGYAACTVCSPSRASIQTGKFTSNHGVLNWIGGSNNPPYEHQLRPEEITFAEALLAAGYKTFYAGKWHIGGMGYWPDHNGYEINKGGWDAGQPTGGYFSPYKNPTLEDGPHSEWLPMRLAAETADFMEANQDRPFLAFLAFYSVHAPIQTTQALWRKYRDKAVAAGLVPEGQRFAIDERILARVVRDNPVYAGMIEEMDDAVGLVLQKLDDLGIADNTIVCFTSDHGGVTSGDAFSTSNLPLRGGKGVPWEGGIRVPFYIRAPGIAAPGSTCDVPVDGVDWYPTILNLAGVPVPAEQAVDGVSLVPLLKGEAIADRAIYWNFPYVSPQLGDPYSIIIEGGWKLLRYQGNFAEELYHVSVDPSETTNLAETEPERRAAMAAKLDAWLAATNSPVLTTTGVRDPHSRDEWLENTIKPRQEGPAARYLEDDYEPGSSWWGSQ